MSESYELYHFDSCPFCRNVRRFLDAKKIDLPLRNIMSDSDARTELVSGGGRSTVPCLKITDQAGQVRWMYESTDIISYLDAKFT